MLLPLTRILARPRSEVSTVALEVFAASTLTALNRFPSEPADPLVAVAIDCSAVSASPSS